MKWGKCAFTQMGLASQAKCCVSPTNGLFKQSSTKTNTGESRLSEFWSNTGCDPLKLVIRIVQVKKMGLILRSTWKWHWKDPYKSTLSWIFSSTPPKIQFGVWTTAPLDSFICTIYLSSAKEVSNNEVGTALQEGGGCGVVPSRGPRAGHFLLWSHVSSSGEEPGVSGSVPPCALQGWDLVPGHGVEQHLALGQGTGGSAEPASGPCGSTEGIAEEKHRCTHGLSTVTAFQGTDSAALNSVPI